jgi:two-component system response regulator AtoC
VGAPCMKSSTLGKKFIPISQREKFAFQSPNPEKERLLWTANCHFMEVNRDYVLLRATDLSHEVAYQTIENTQFIPNPSEQSGLRLLVRDLHAIPRKIMATTVTERSEQLTNGIVYGESQAMRSLNAMVAEIAKTDIPVLLIGESGTGKEVYARLIHQASALGAAPLKKVFCAALDAERSLAEIREEFLSDGGSGEAGARTVFLDGVHELDAAGQRVLLSLLPDGEPKGCSGKTVWRFIFATSRNLEKEVQAGRFRRELYFRINGAILQLPPLRERKEDIPALLEYFLAKHSIELKKDTPELSRDTRELLIAYDWPGNIRELENLAKKIVAVGDATLAVGNLQTITATEPIGAESGSISSLKVAARAASRRAERELILKALEQTHWNRKRAARELQISYKSLLYKIKQIGVEVPSSGEV